MFFLYFCCIGSVFAAMREDAVDMPYSSNSTPTFQTKTKAFGNFRFENRALTPEPVYDTFLDLKGDISIKKGSVACLYKLTPQCFVKYAEENLPFLDVEARAKRFADFVHSFTPPYVHLLLLCIKSDGKAVARFMQVWYTDSDFTTGSGMHIKLMACEDVVSSPKNIRRMLNRTKNPMFRLDVNYFIAGKRFIIKGNTNIHFAMQRTDDLIHSPHCYNTHILGNVHPLGAFLLVLTKMSWKFKGRELPLVHPNQVLKYHDFGRYPVEDIFEMFVELHQQLEKERMEKIKEGLKQGLQEMADAATQVFSQVSQNAQESCLIQ